MAGSSIKLFQFLQKFCRTFGINSGQSNQNRYHINLANWFALLCLNEYLISTAVFFLLEASSMVEYGITFYICISTAACDFYCLSAFWQVKNISKFVANWEEFIGKSESHWSSASKQMINL